MCCSEPAGGSFVGSLKPKLGNMTKSGSCQIRVLAVSKLNSIPDRISAALTDDQISEEEFRLILSEVDKYDQMKAEIRRGRQKEGGLPETEKKRLMNLMRDEMMLTARGQLLEELRAAGNSGTSR